MGGYAAAAPLNLAGPWGTAAWLVVGTGLTLLTVAGLVTLGEKVREDTRTRTDAPAIPRVADKTETKKCERKSYMVRVQAQGRDCGGTTGSTIGVPALVQPVPILVVEALALSKGTQALLNRTQLKNRLLEIPKAEAYIIKGPSVGGYYGQKTFQNLKLPGGIRYDVDCMGSGKSLLA